MTKKIAPIKIEEDEKGVVVPYTANLRQIAELKAKINEIISYINKEGND